MAEAAYAYPPAVASVTILSCVSGVTILSCVSLVASVTLSCVSLVAGRDSCSELEA